ncbi:MAG: hypothetical protein ACKVZJ_06395 [Phycisphaerales bacterium]
MTAPPSDDDLLKSAQSLHDQALFLLEDEISYANALRESRKTATTLIALMVGVGIFKLDLYRDPGQELAVPPVAWWWIRACFCSALLGVLLGAYFIYTERGWDREFSQTSDGGKKGGALSILFLSPTVLKEYHEKGPIEVMRMRTDGIRFAYSRLRDANRRVRKRIAIGTMLVILSLAFVLVGFVLYVWMVGLT